MTKRECSLDAKSPKTEDQLHEEETREDKAGMLQRLANFWNPLIILDPLITVDQGDQNISEQARYIQGDQGQDEIVLLLGDE